MALQQSSYRGCLLGMAVGDAMGYTVDARSWQEIREDYGPNGLLGYDLANGTAEVSSYTQLAAYTANGLLLALNRGKLEGYPKFIGLSMKEWARKQNLPRDPEKTWCWVSKIPQLRRRHCRDSRMLDALRFDTLGTPEAPTNRNDAPGSLTAAAMVGLAFDPKRMDPPHVGILGAKAVAMTHGNADAFLSGAVLAYAVAGITAEPKVPLMTHFEQAISAMDAQFSGQFPYAKELAAQLKKALELADPDCDGQAVMEQLECRSAGQCLAGAMFASLSCAGDLDTAMVLAVNHSGRSAAVGALTGALLGAKLGADALPEFYLENLDVVAVLETLAQDLEMGTPTSGLFDDDWDLKYTRGIPVGNYGQTE